MAHRRTVTGLGLLLSVLALSAAAGAADKEVYVGTVAVGAGAQATATALTLTVREYTPDERVFGLADLLHRKGHPAAVAEMATGEAGAVRLGDGPTVKATVIRQEKTATGRLLRIITERPLHAAAAGTPPLPSDAVGYLELKLSGAGEGSGRLLPAITVVFDAEGFLAPQSLGPEWPVSGVKPGK
jgi:hypothetical protein